MIIKMSLQVGGFGVLAFAFYWAAIAFVLHYLLSKIITRKKA